VTVRALQDALTEMHVVRVTSAARPSDGLGVLTVNEKSVGRWTGMDEFANKIAGTKLFKDLTRRLDDPTRYDDFPARVKELLLADLHELAAKHGASVRQFQETVQNDKESLAIQMSEITAAVQGASAGVRHLEAASASATRAVSVVATTITARLDEFPDVNAGSGVATVELIAQAIADRATGLEGQYVVKVSAGGYQAGIGLASTSGGIGGAAPTSAFIVQADKFAIVDSSYTGGLTTAPPADSLLFGVDGDGAHVKGNLKIGGKAIISGNYTHGSLSLNAALFVNDTTAATNGVVALASASGSTAVYARNTHATAGTAVYGETTGTGKGVHGLASNAGGGVGVRAEGGLASTALQVIGPMTIDNSTLVENLNAEFLGGSVAADFAPAVQPDTFTPTLSFGGSASGLTYAQQVGHARLIDDMAFVQFYVLLTNKGISTGGAVISGLPYTAVSGSFRYGTLSIYMSGVSVAGHLEGYIDPGTTNFVLRKVTSGGTASLTDADFTNGTDILVSGCYLAQP
jgi:hypothetical protein